MARADLTVMGAGAFGLSVAWAAARRGARVRVIEHRHVGAGASGGVVGALMPHAPGAGRWDEAKAFQRDSLIMAADWWAGVEAASGLSAGFARLGRLSPLADDRAVANARLAARAAADHWGTGFRYEVTDTPPDTPPDWAPLSSSGLWLHETLSGRLAPRAALAALAGAVLGRGGTIEVGPTEPPDSPVVWATGWQGLQALGGGGVKGQAARLAADPGAVPLIHAAGLFIVPHADGTVAVGSTSERDRTDTDTDSGLDMIVDRARALVPALRDAPVIERWAGIRPRAPGGQAILGAHPLRPGHFIANGGFKTGFGLAPLAGEMLADLVLDGRDRIPAALKGG